MSVPGPQMKNTVRDSVPTSIEPRPRANILSIPEYIPGEAGAPGAARTFKLSSNESPLGPSPKARAVCESLAPQLHRYPDASMLELRMALGARYRLDAQRIVGGCGSEELLHLAARAYAGPGDTVVISQYAFVGHRIAAMVAGAELKVVPERNFCVDLDAMAEAVDSRTTLVYLANPGNPTGTVVSGDALRKFHARLPRSVLLVVDAAYAEFVEGKDGYDCGISLLQEGADNVLVTRTFSKMYGLAGLRIGWGYGTAAIASAINRVRPAFNCNALAQAAALAALEDDEFVSRSQSLNEQGLRQLREGLLALGIRTTESVCNFVLAQFPGGAAQAASAFQSLRQRGVIVRPVGGYGIPDCLRISVGLAEDNAAVTEGLTAFMREP